MSKYETDVVRAEALTKLSEFHQKMRELRNIDDDHYNQEFIVRRFLKALKKGFEDEEEHNWQLMSDCYETPEIYRFQGTIALHCSPIMLWYILSFVGRCHDSDVEGRRKGVDVHFSEYEIRVTVTVTMKK